MLCFGRNKCYYAECGPSEYNEQKLLFYFSDFSPAGPMPRFSILKSTEIHCSTCLVSISCLKDINNYTSFNLEYKLGSSGDINQERADLIMLQHVILDPDKSLEVNQ
jgi:hypothetical protein